MKKILLICTVLSVLLTAGCGQIFRRIDNMKNNIDKPETTEQELTESEHGFLDIRIGTDIYVHQSQYNKTRGYKNETLVKFPDGEKYPELEQSVSSMLEERKQNNAAVFEKMMKQLDEVVSPAVYPEKTWDFYDTAAVVRSDNRALSMVFKYEPYFGTKRESYSLHGENFDVQTGKRLKLADVVQDVSRLAELVKNNISEQYGDIKYIDGFDVTEYITAQADKINWVLGYEGLTIMFNPDEAFPWTYGVVTAFVPFNKAAEIFNKKYTCTPKAYAEQLPDLMGYYGYRDMNGDGKYENISVYSFKDEYDTLDTITVEAGGDRYTLDVFGYNVKSSLIHTKDGKDYIYTEIESENDWADIHIFEISSKGITYVDVAGFGICHEYTDEVWYDDVLNNPDKFRLSTRTNVLSTASVHSTFAVGPNGMPVNTGSEFYEVDNPYEFTLMKSLEAELIEKESNKILGKTTLMPGDKVTYFRTDDEYAADLLLSDGRIARVHRDGTEWPYTINGVDINEIFQGLIFAG